MQTNNFETTKNQAPLRAMVELIDGDLKIYPIAESDREADEIINSLLFWKASDGR